MFPSQQTFRILVVEDKWERRKLLVYLLEPWGFEVRETQNGREGVEASILGAAGCDEFIRKSFREEYIVKAMADHTGVLFIY